MHDSLAWPTDHVKDMTFHVLDASDKAPRLGAVALGVVALALGLQARPFRPPRTS